MEDTNSNPIARAGLLLVSIGLYIVSFYWILLPPQPLRIWYEIYRGGLATAALVLIMSIILTSSVLKTTVILLRVVSLFFASIGLVTLGLINVYKSAPPTIQQHFFLYIGLALVVILIGTEESYRGWRHKSPTQKQKNYARALGIHSYGTRGALADKIAAKTGNRRRIK